MTDPRLVNGRAVRDRILRSIAERVAAAKVIRPIGRILSVSIGENKAAAVYVRGQASAAKKVGLTFEEQTWPSGLTQDECKARLVAMNDDPRVLGVILQRPVPRHRALDRPSRLLIKPHAILDPHHAHRLPLDGRTVSSSTLPVNPERRKR